MDNYQIADSFSLLAKLSDIHGENSFKAKSYATAAFTIEKLPVQLSETPHEKIFSIKGIGESTGKKIIEILTTGQLKSLDEIIEKTPPGVMELLNIKGIGPKKIATIWKEMEIESVGELLYACKENRLKLFKGFGEKTQHNVIETIEFYLKSKGSFLFSQINLIANEVKTFFEKIFLTNKIAFTGAYTRQLEIIHELQLVIDDTTDNIKNKLASVNDFELIEDNQYDLLYQAAVGIKIRVYGCDKTPFMQQVFLNSCSDEFATTFSRQFESINYAECENEEAVFTSAGIHYIPPFQREFTHVIDKAKQAALPPLLQVKDIKGIIHSHSNWSDGGYTIEEMAKAAIVKSYEYLVISDHSKSAFYANGLQEERIKEQHLYIDQLNQQLAPFKIFKSIESDILNDGSLDYSNTILSTFDLVIASVHSNLKMSEDKAMLRLITAIENPYTTILGHMTGRLLLSRKGYPVDHKKIIDACAANNVVIELNAHPSRLDIDWRHIEYALEKNVLISIDPDAHSLDGFDDIQYGVLAAQKAMVSKEKNLSSFSLQELEAFLLKKKTAGRN
ncbi:helix-hairpin-helix domain-containing protein [Ferruginibacter paludis]|uniref:DNA polymerase/3'-5' exonuclease PolX n=1 Tax=Ferruginibacter paludis TaxID=1310417 RepID=UPI0025B4246D|nr:DNA polymerase/3'-5' exonuclease PolX [Ferruginibacter paludis]MDN3655694.1 helix-hairpin-helix domain-containing protein [Ferruginibacter paludis]